jgi:hypothetical protein
MDDVMSARRVEQAQAICRTELGRSSLRDIENMMRIIIVLIIVIFTASSTSDWAPRFHLGLAPFSVAPTRATVRARARSGCGRRIRLTLHAEPHES